MQFLSWFQLCHLWDYCAVQKSSCEQDPRFWLLLFLFNLLGWSAQAYKIHKIHVCFLSNAYYHSKAKESKNLNPYQKINP